MNFSYRRTVGVIFNGDRHLEGLGHFLNKRPMMYIRDGTNAFNKALVWQDGPWHGKANPFDRQVQFLAEFGKLGLEFLPSRGRWELSLMAQDLPIKDAILNARPPDIAN